MNPEQQFNRILEFKKKHYLLKQILQSEITNLNKKLPDISIEQLNLLLQYHDKQECNYPRFGRCIFCDNGNYLNLLKLIEDKKNNKI